MSSHYQATMWRLTVCTLAFMLSTFCVEFAVISQANPDFAQQNECLMATKAFFTEEHSLSLPVPLDNPIPLKMSVTDTDELEFTVVWGNYGAGDNFSLQTVGETDSPREIMRIEQEAIFAVDISSSGKWFAISHGNLSENRLEVTNLRTDERLILYQNERRGQRGDPDRIDQMIIYENRNLLFGVEAFSNDLFVWDLLTGDMINSVNSIVPPETMAISPSGKWLAIGSSRDGELALWDLDQLSMYNSISTDLSIVDIAFSYDDHQFAAADMFGRLYLWNSLNDPTEMRIQHSDFRNVFYVNTIAFHPILPVLASAGFDGGIRLWDTTTGEMISAFEAHEYELGEIYILKFNAGGDRLLSASRDLTVKVWDFRCIAEKYD